MPGLRITNHEIIIGEKYRITYNDSYSGKVAEAKSMDEWGDVDLVFKNGNVVTYHRCWLEWAGH